MIVIEDVRKIVNYHALSEIEQGDLKNYFETHSTDQIVEIEADKYSTYKQALRSKEPVDIRVKYTPDMFLAAMPIIYKYGYAIADDEEGEHIAVLRNELCTYVHRYKYSGGVDMWFLDQYECIFLCECNEFSVELCQSALKLWKGKRLVLVGENWERMIPMLPDLPRIECFYEPQLSEARMFELSYGEKTLRIIYGMPHAEAMDRYKMGIMYYDEVMSFTFMFSDYREMGDLNADKNFFVMDGYYGMLGLFTMFAKVKDCARYAKNKGFIPVVQLKMPEGSFYQNEPGDDIWKKFYNQPENYSIDEVMNSKHVFFSPGFYNGSVQSTIMRQACRDEIDLTWPNGKYNQRVLSYIEQKQAEFLPYPEKTLGVLARGTDYVNTKLHNHSIHASKELICEKIDEVWESWGGFEYIYIATEDEGYCEFFKKKYGDRVFFTDQKRYRTENGEMLAQMHQKEKVKRDGYILGVEYILSINLLSKCHSLIASGNCAGVGEAMKENKGKYKNVFVFDFGVNG